MQGWYYVNSKHAFYGQYTNKWMHLQCSSEPELDISYSFLDPTHFLQFWPSIQKSQMDQSAQQRRPRMLDCNQLNVSLNVTSTHLHVVPCCSPLDLSLSRTVMLSLESDPVLWECNIAWQGEGQNLSGLFGALRRTLMRSNCANWK